jgi:hypothetical protein
MSETTILKSSAINRNASPGASSAKSHAQLSGPLPVLQVNMTANGPQLQNSRARSAVTPSRDVRRAVTSGLPVVQVKMSPNGPQQVTPTGTQLQSVPNQPRASQVQVSRVPQVQEPVQAQELSTDQLLLCRHLADKYLGELRTIAGDAQLEGSAADNVKLASSIISAIDAAMIARTTAEAAAAVAEVVVITPPSPAPRAVPPPPRAVVVGQRSQANTSVTPRRVSRPAPPPVIVKMDAGVPILQDQAPVDPAVPADDSTNG